MGNGGTQEMNFLDLSPLPSTQAGPLDALPDQTAIGLRVTIPLGQGWHHGRVRAVAGRHVTIDLEKKLGTRSRVTLNWTVARIAESQETPDPPKPKPALDPERVQRLRDAVKERTHVVHTITTDANDAQRLLDTCRSLSNNITEYLSTMEAYRRRVKDLIVLFHESRDACISYGIDDILLPSSIESVRDVEIKTGAKRKGNMEQRRALRQLRDHAKDMLVILVTEAGDEGVSSEEIMAVLCDDSLGIAQHRIMGMLSALSRRKEVFLSPTGKWRLT